MTLVSDGACKRTKGGIYAHIMTTNTHTHTSMGNYQRKSTNPKPPKENRSTPTTATLLENAHAYVEKKKRDRVS